MTSSLHLFMSALTFLLQSLSGGERVGSGRSGRRRSGAIVHVTKLYDGSNLSLVSAPSTASMQSVCSTSQLHNNSDSSQPTVVEVGVGVDVVGVDGGGSVTVGVSVWCVRCCVHACK